MAYNATSVLAKLQNKAKETGRSYQLCLQLFCQEEFLRRVERSKFADNLVLKGGLFIYTLTGFDSRATLDIDFLLKQAPNTESEVLRMVEEIAAIKTENDYISFQIRKISSITLHRKYNGLSVALMCMIQNTRTPFNIDFGIGDIVIPKPEKKKIPTQLDGFAQPEISTYSLESAIAEKIDAIISRLEFTSRMKDFYDIYFLARTFVFEGDILREAIAGTLKNRGTKLDRDTFNNIEGLLSFDVINKRWKTFLKKIKTTEPEFAEVLSMIIIFLKPIIDAIIEEREFSGLWICSEHKWKGVQSAMVQNNG